MTDSTVIYSKSGHVARIILNRPGANNAIDGPLADDLAAACRQVNQDDDVYAVILTGAGKTFCSSSELRDKANLAAAIAGIDRPVIAAINGDAIGAGLELALSADIRLASDKAHFGLPQITEGQIPTDGGTQRLPRIVGRGKALELLFTGRTLDAQEALDIGLVNKIVPEAQLAAEAEALATSLAAKGPVALRYIKEAVNKGLDLTLEQGLRLEGDLYFLIHTTADRTEGIKAFLEKRPPKFKGK